MRRDFENYLTAVQKQYTDMNKAIEEVNEKLANGEFSKEAAEPIIKYYNIVSTNYQRLLYCRHLYNLPPKFIQKLRKKKMEKEAAKFVAEHSDKDSVVKENQDSLDTIKEVIDENNRS